MIQMRWLALVLFGITWRAFFRFLRLIDKKEKFGNMAFRTTREENFVKFLRFLSVE